MDLLENGTTIADCNETYALTMLEIKRFEYCCIFVRYNICLTFMDDSQCPRRNKTIKILHRRNPTRIKTHSSRAIARDNILMLLPIIPVNPGYNNIIPRQQIPFNRTILITWCITRNSIHHSNSSMLVCLIYLSQEYPAWWFLVYTWAVFVLSPVLLIDCEEVLALECYVDAVLVEIEAVCVVYYVRVAVADDQFWDVYVIEVFYEVLKTYKECTIFAIIVVS